MKKGFTLTELLAVIVVLGLLAVILIPTISNFVNDSKDTLKKQQITTVINGAKKYAVENTDILPEAGNVVKVSVDKLIEEGVIESSSDDVKITGCVVISYNESYNQYDYTYNEVCS